ncbi:MAG: DinB family protein [Betaproteobacteria bacterium]
MKKTLCLLPLVAAAVVAATLRPAAQSTTTLHADLLKDWTAMKDRMVKISDAMPEEKFSFKPTPAQRSYGEQILHVAGANVMMMKMLGGKAAAPAINEKATSKADILKAIADSYDYGTAVLNEQTDQSLLEAVPGPRFLGPSTRARLVWFTLGHAWDEYGNMTTYLRLNGIVPPASRGM